MGFLNEALPMTVDEFALANLKGKKILVMGLGLFGGGAGVARFLVSRGARVTVTDLKGEEDLQESLEALKGLPIRYKLGGHEEEDFKDADMIIVNPAVPRDSKFLEIARKEEVVLEDGSVVTKQIKFSICRCGHSKRMPFCDGEHKFAKAIAMPLSYEPATPNDNQ